MSAPTTEFDYEAIVKQFMKKSIATAKLEGTTNTLDVKLWSAFCDYYEVKNKCEYAKASINGRHHAISEETKKRSIIDRERTFLDQKLEKMLQQYNEDEAKRAKETEQFFSNMAELNTALQKLSYEFESENIKNQVKSHLKSISLFEQKMLHAEEELESLKKSMKNSKLEMPNVKEVTEIIQKESIDRYDNPMKIQGRLSEIRRNIEFLSKKVQDIKVKYDI